MDDKRVARQERQLLAIPSEFRKLTTWAWTELKPSIEKHAREHGLDPVLASQMGARLSRLVVTQMYGDITRGRTIPRIPS